MKWHPTKYEKIFLEKLKKFPIDYKTQVIVGFYIVDFIVPSRMICFEIDGLSHTKKKDYDEFRDNFLRNMGFNVIRINNEDAENYNLEWILGVPPKERAFRSALGRANARRGTAIRYKRKR